MCINKLQRKHHVYPADSSVWGMACAGSIHWHPNYIQMGGAGSGWGFFSPSPSSLCSSQVRSVEGSLPLACLAICSFSCKTGLGAGQEEDQQEV